MKRNGPRRLQLIERRAVAIDTFGFMELRGGVGSAGVNAALGAAQAASEFQERAPHGFERAEAMSGRVRTPEGAPARACWRLPGRASMPRDALPEARSARVWDPGLPGGGAVGLQRDRGARPRTARASPGGVRTGQLEPLHVRRFDRGEPALQRPGLVCASGLPGRGLRTWGRRDLPL
jgi:hypothetical protein